MKLFPNPKDDCYNPEAWVIGLTSGERRVPGMLTPAYAGVFPIETPENCPDG
ncbi:hypothetical protein DES49_0249 [Halospina denitrificans]|uniref:Uncharacterized protein n=1 Tax=Halospina denitrificans TaxID=332522 RepID=A0A4R7K3H9_9GAMM|nr:hypothetical protein DES49_0249 [Halospina denitrificans]